LNEINELILDKRRGKSTMQEAICVRQKGVNHGFPDFFPIEAAKIRSEQRKPIQAAPAETPKCSVTEQNQSSCR
jgi:hypothetical protein